MQSRLDKSIARKDVWELVALARAQPESSEEIARGLATILPQIHEDTASGRWDLIYLTSLPNRPEYSAVSRAATERLIALGPDVKPTVLSALEKLAITKETAGVILAGIGDSVSASEVVAGQEQPVPSRRQRPAYWAFFWTGWACIALSVVVGVVWGAKHAVDTELNDYAYLAWVLVLWWLGVVLLVVWYLWDQNHKRDRRHEELLRLGQGASVEPRAAGEAEASGPRPATSRASMSGTPLVADELMKLASLLKEGLMTRDEFESQKRLILASEREDRN